MDEKQLFFWTAPGHVAAITKRVQAHERVQFLWRLDGACARSNALYPNRRLGAGPDSAIRYLGLVRRQGARRQLALKKAGSMWLMRSGVFSKAPSAPRSNPV